MFIQVFVCVQNLPSSIRLPNSHVSTKKQVARKIVFLKVVFCEANMRNIGMISWFHKKFYSKKLKSIQSIFRTSGVSFLSLHFSKNTPVRPFLSDSSRACMAIFSPYFWQFFNILSLAICVSFCLFSFRCFSNRANKSQNS